MKVSDVITHGVYVLGTRDGEKLNLMTAAWLCQTSGNGPQIMVAVGKTHLTADMIKKSGTFSVSVLGDGQKDIAVKCGAVSGRTADKLNGLETSIRDNGCPVICGSSAYLDCKVVAVHESTDHVLFEGKVENAELFSRDVLLYNNIA